MTQDQVLSYARQLLTIFGTMIGTTMVAKGWVTAEQWSSILEFVLGTGLPIGIATAWKWHVHSDAGKLKSVAAIPDVAVVRMAPTPAGQALADAVPSSKVTT